MVIGQEYLTVNFEMLDHGKGKKRKGSTPTIPPDLTEEEKKYIYANPEGKIIFTPIYQIYNDSFLREIIDNTKIIPTFDMFHSTDWFEKYTANAFQFSAAKGRSTAILMQSQVYDESGKLRSWAQFRDRADEIQFTQNKVWLRVEHDNCQRNAVLADKFTDMRADADLYPYWIYTGRLDSRERPEHRALEGLIFRIGDPYGDRMFPPEDWNCRCTGKPVDDLFLRRNNRSVQTDAQAKDWLEAKDPATGKPFVDEQFRYNPADQGTMPKTGSYFEDFKGANVGNAAMFGLKGSDKPEVDTFASKRFTYFLNIVHDWKQTYHVDHLDNLVFQNKNLLTNVWFTNHSVHEINKHSRGVELLPDTIANPSEVWMRWEDTESQQTTLRNYVQLGEKSAYIVQTRAGAVQDAFIVSRKQADKYRKGVPYIKH